MKSQKGFTLIELLVVVAILGILAAVVIPNVAKFIGRGNLEAANTELSTVETAVVAYMADNNGGMPEVTETNYDDIKPYLNGVLKGTYTLSGNITVTGVDYPNLEWGDGQWIEPQP